MRCIRVGVVSGLCAVVVPCACANTAQPPAHESEPSLRVSAPLPETRQAFLAELLPLPAETLVVVYDVRGPAGLEGTLEVLARPGGFRRDNWRLQLPVESGADEPIVITGSTIQTPDENYRDAVEGGPVVEAVALGALADAYLAAEPQVRTATIRTIRDWHQALAEGRARQPGVVREVAGVECLQTRVAQSTLCVWEDAGLPLAYEGSAFTVQAKHIERDSELGERAFDVPATDELGPAPTFDPHQTLRALADGDFASLAVLTQPGLGVPQPGAILGG